MEMNNEYWWASDDQKGIVSRLEPYSVRSFAAWGNNPVVQTWFRNSLLYNSNVVAPSNFDTSLVFKGKQGELIQMYVPVSRSLIKQIVGVLTKQNLSFKCLIDPKAGNIASPRRSSAMETARLGNALAKDIVKQQQLDIVYANAIENALVVGMSFIYVRWRTDLGPIHTKDMQGVQHFKGDVKISVPSIWDVNFDFNIPDPRDWQWVQVREIMNRWDLIAQFPDLKQDILALPSVRESMGWYNYRSQIMPSDDDLVFIWNAYHKPSPALPNGRFMAYGSTSCILYDGDNHYGELPVYCSRPEPIPNTGLGYAFFSNLTPMQEIFDACISSIATNNSAFAVQNILAPRGAGLNKEQFLGMNWISYTPQPGMPDGGKPSPLQMTQSAPETYKFIEMLKGLMGEISQVNAALRGDPPPQVSSGTAIATLTATAYETINATNKTGRMQLHQAMLGAINCYRRFASVERSLSTSYVGGQTVSVDFLGEDLDPIKDIELQEVNPLMNTLGGRIEIADKVMASGLITNLKGYFSVLEGTPPEELYKSQAGQDELVNRENEALINGEEVVVLNIDDHAYHIMMHAVPLNDPKVRLDPQLAQRFLAHIEEHNQLARQRDPVFAAMVETGKMPMMPEMPPQGGAAPEVGQTAAAGSEVVGNVAKPTQDPLGREGAGDGLPL